MNKAVFLDRDGTLIYDKDYLHDPNLVELIPRTQEAVIQLAEAGYLLFLFTNQSGIGRGYFPIEDAIACNQKTEELLGKNFCFHEICIAPEAPDQPSQYRKPSPLFIEEMIAKYDLSKKDCWMIGDRLSDIEAGYRAGIQSILLECGKEIPEKTRHFAENHGIPCFADIHDALALINKV